MRSVSRFMFINSFVALSSAVVVMVRYESPGRRTLNLTLPILTLQRDQARQANKQQQTDRRNLPAHTIRSMVLTSRRKRDFMLRTPRVLVVATIFGIVLLGTVTDRRGHNDVEYVMSVEACGEGMYGQDLFCHWVVPRGTVPWHTRFGAWTRKWSTLCARMASNFWA